MVAQEWLFHRFAWFAAERFVRLGVGFVVGAVVARHLGPESYGVLSYAGSVVAVLAVLFGSGIDSLVVRDLSRDDGSAGQVLGTAMLLRLLLGALGVGACGVLAWVKDGDVAGSLILAQSCLMLFGWGEVLGAWFQSRSNPRAGVWVRVGSGLLGGVVRLILVELDAGVMAFAIAGVVEVAVLAVGMWLVFSRMAKEARPLTVNRSQFVRLSSEGWPLVISALLVMIVMQGDRIVLGWMGSPQEMGYYAVSTRFLDVSLVFPMLLGMTIQRVFVREVGAGMSIASASSAVIRRIWVGASWAGILAAIILWAVAHGVVQMAFGSAYARAGAILAVHAWIVIFVMQVSLRTRMLVAQGHQRLVLMLSIFTVVIHMGLLPWAIEGWGSMGAAWATLTAWVAGALVGPLFFKQTRWFVVAFFRGLLFPFSYSKYGN